MTSRRAVVLFAVLTSLAAACGDSGAGTAATAAGGTDTPPATVTTTTAPPPTSTTLATTTTTGPAPPRPDVAAIADCGELVDAAMAAVQQALDELGSMTVADLAEFTDGVPPAIDSLNEVGLALEARSAELECDVDAIEAGLVARVDELQASGPLGELILEGLKEEAAAGGDAGPADPPEGVEYFEVTDRSHTENSVDYPHDPPVGGPHDAVWQNCGFYSEPVRTENAVHSLEHGAVWITYDVGFATGAELGALRALAAEPKVLVSPYPDLVELPIVASAWGAQMRFDTALDPELRQFVDALRDTLAPEPGAGCLGGIGEPEG